MNKTAYFFLIPAAVSRDNYAHNALVLAEGLQELGWKIYANIDYWRSRPDDPATLFRHDPAVRPSDCAINVLTYDWLHFVKEIPFEFAENKRSFRVYLEDDGGMHPPGLGVEFRAFDLILKSHFNRRTTYPENYRPWSFGISRRILKETEEAAVFSSRRKELLVNFGATHSYRHQLRDLFEEKVYPGLEGELAFDRFTNSRSNPPADPYHRLMWEQTAWRHYPDYYVRLRNCVACSCVGGQFVPGIPDNWHVYDGGGGVRTRLRQYGYRLVSRISGSVPRWSQWESWRFWESLGAGTAALMLDFEKYGVQIPVQPENWVHYIGLDLDNLSRDLDRLRSDRDVFARVGQAGRDWVRRHYSPLPLAEQFLRVAGR